MLAHLERSLAEGAIHGSGAILSGYKVAFAGAYELEHLDPGVYCVIHYRRPLSFYKSKLWTISSSHLHAGADVDNDTTSASDGY